MTQEKRREQHAFSSGDLQTILEVNKKAIEIHVEVEQQYEEMNEKIDKIKDMVEDIDKAFFRLLIILGTISVGTIIGILQLISGHK